MGAVGVETPHQMTWQQSQVLSGLSLEWQWNTTPGWASYFCPPFGHDAMKGHGVKDPFLFIHFYQSLFKQRSNFIQSALSSTEVKDIKNVTTVVLVEPHVPDKHCACAPLYRDEKEARCLTPLQTASSGPNEKNSTTVSRCFPLFTV